MKLFIFIAIIWVYCILSNAYWFRRAKILHKKFQSSEEIASYIPEIDELFKNAGTSYLSCYDEDKGGYSQRVSRDVAYLSDKKRYSTEVNKVFSITIGTFRQRLKHSIFPIHLDFLPTHLFNAKEKRVPILLKLLLTGIYWFVCTIGAYIFNALLDFAFLDKLNTMFEKIL